MSAKQQLIKEIREAYIFLREKNQSIPSETLDFMKDAAIKAANDLPEPIEFIDNKRTCTTCRFSKGGKYGNCWVGSYYAEQGRDRTCYAGELWEPIISETTKIK